MALTGGSPEDNLIRTLEANQVSAEETYEEATQWKQVYVLTDRSGIKSIRLQTPIQKETNQFKLKLKVLEARKMSAEETYENAMEASLSLARLQTLIQKKTNQLKLKLKVSAEEKYKETTQWNWKQVYL